MRKRKKEITTHDGTKLTITDPKKTLPFTVEDLIRMEREGPSDEAVSSAWLYGSTGKAPR
jgi:hypothetical protein